MKRAAKALASLLLLGGVFAYGVAVGRYEIFPFGLLKQFAGDSSVLRSGDDETGRWSKLRGADDGDPDGLAGLPYLQGYEPAGGQRGVVVHDRERVGEGLTLFSSGHAPVVSLIDVDGKVVHEWRTSFSEAWPDGVGFDHWRVHRSFIRRAHLFPDGGLLVLFEYIGLVRLDRDSKILWSVSNQAHHDLTITSDGKILTLTRFPRTRASLARDHPGVDFAGDLQDDRVTWLDLEGTEIRSVSLLDAFLRSRYAPHLANVRWEDGDILHTNSVDPVGPVVAARHPFADEGDVLLSVRNIDTLAILDTKTGLIRWVAAGMWRRQHQAQFLPSDNLLLFDNRGGPADAATGSESSRILEFDPVTQETRWRYGGRGHAPFYSKALGSVRRLGNGNTLITESHQGRILEVAPDGKVVWEYRNPHRAGENDELIATIMGAQRIDPATLEFL